MNKEKLLINDDKSNNSNAKSNKPYIVTNPEIEEMAEVIAATEKIALDAHCGYPSPRMYATDLYRKGYKKQSKGKWRDRGVIKRMNLANAPIVECSECNIAFCDIINNHYFIYWYCPYCGAKMKGE